MLILTFEPIALLSNILKPRLNIHTTNNEQSLFRSENKQLCVLTSRTREYEVHVSEPFC